VLSGYLFATVSSFLQQRPRETLNYFLQSEAPVLPLLVANVHLSSVAQLLCAILMPTTSDEFDDGENHDSPYNSFESERVAVVKQLLADYPAASLDKKSAIAEIIKTFTTNFWKWQVGASIARDAIFDDLQWLEATIELATRDVEGSTLKQRIARRVDLQLVRDVVSLLVVEQQTTQSSPVLAGHSASRRSFAVSALTKVIRESTGNNNIEFVLSTVIVKIFTALQKVFCCY
jgi:hypothetical protein